MRDINTRLKQADKKISELAKSISLFSYSNPSNALKEKKKFLAYENYEPVFEYKEIDFNPGDKINELGRVDIPEGHPMSGLEEMARDYILLQIKALQARGTEEWTKTELFGVPSEETIRLAEKILKESPQSIIPPKGNFNAEDFVREMKQVIEYYGWQGWRFILSKEYRKVNIEPATKEISFWEGDTFSKERLIMLKAHEILGHALITENAEQNSYRVLVDGHLPGRLVLEEGITKKHEEIVGYANLKKSAAHVIATVYALEHGFRKVFNELIKRGMNEEMAWEITLKSKRGLEDASKPGGFINAHIYLEGLIMINRHLKENKKMDDLYAAKIGLDQIELVDKRVIKPPEFLPNFELII